MSSGVKKRWHPWRATALPHAEHIIQCVCTYISRILIVSRQRWLHPSDRKFMEGMFRRAHVHCGIAYAAGVKTHKSRAAHRKLADAIGLCTN
jgi:hypothetical protein